MKTEMRFEGAGGTVEGKETLLKKVKRVRWLQSGLKGIKEGEELEKFFFCC